MSRGPTALVLAAVALAGCIAPVEEPAPTTPAAAEAWRGFLVPAGTLAGAGVAAPHNFVTNPVTMDGNELVIAVNPKDPLNLIAGAKDYRLGRDHPCLASGDGATYPVNVWTGVYWSRDGGATWSEALMPGHPADEANATHPNRTWPCNSDPVVVFGEDGTAYFSGLGIRGPVAPDPLHPCVERNRSVWLMTSRDGGATWTDFVCVGASTAQGGVGGVIDKQWFAVDGPHVYFTYMEFNPSGAAAGGAADLLFRHSGDGGRTWDPERTLVELSPTDADAATEGRQFSTPVVGPDGTVYVSWLNFGADTAVYLARSTNHGASFEPARRIFAVSGLAVDAPYRMGSYPVLAADAGDGNHSGTLYLTWAGMAEGDARVFVATSKDGGLTWNNPIHLSDHGAGDQTLQFMPWIAVSPGGVAHVVWLDGRESGNVTRLDVVHRLSTDGGATWSPMLRVNEKTIETEGCHHQNGGPFIGDYLGLAASDLAIHPLWPDGRDGKCRAMTATVLRGTP